MRSIYLSLILLAVSLSLSASTTLTMMSGGIQRDLIIHLPPTYTPGQHLPVVFNFHGYTSTAAQQETYSGMDANADTNNYIVIYPDGISNSWNVGWTGNYWTGVDDVRFVSDMIDTLYHLYSIDLTRVYATGLSNGGFLSHRLACELEYRIAAIAAVSGTLTDSTYVYCHPTRIMPIMHIHGTSDPIVAYTGVPSSRSVEQTIAFWVNKNTCGTPGDTTDLPNTDLADNCTVQKIDYPICNNNTRVLFYKITGGGHTWPNGTTDITVFGNTDHDMDGNTEIWNFFKQYSWSGATLGIKVINDQPATVKAYPNPFGDEIQIESSHRIDEVEVFNILGERVYYSPENLMITSIHLDRLDRGIYLLKVSGKDYNYVERISKN